MPPCAEVHAEPVEESEVRREERLADVESGEARLFEDQDVVTRAREEIRGGAPGGGAGARRHRVAHP